MFSHTMENALDIHRLQAWNRKNDKWQRSTSCSRLRVFTFLWSLQIKKFYDDDIYIEAFWSIQSFLTPTLPLALPTPIVYFVTRAAVAAVAPVPNFPAKTLVWWKMFYNSTGYVRSFFCGNFSTLKLHETTETTGYCLERIRSWLR